MHLIIYRVNASFGRFVFYVGDNPVLVDVRHKLQLGERGYRGVSPSCRLFGLLNNLRQKKINKQKRGITEHDKKYERPVAGDISDPLYTAFCPTRSDQVDGSKMILKPTRGGSLSGYLFAGICF